MIRPIVTPPFDDSRALWDGSDPETGYDLLSDDPDPAHATLRWANGTPSGYSLRDISAAGPAMELTVEVPAQVPALTTVPHVRFSPATVAAQQVRAAELIPKFTGVTGDGNRWVFSQSPHEGSAVPIGTIVTMQLRGGPVP